MATEQIMIRILTRLDEIRELESFWRLHQRKPAIDFEFYQFLVRTRPEIEGPCVFVASSEGSIKGILVGRIERASFSVRIGYQTVMRIPVRQLVLMDGGWMGTEEETLGVTLFQKARQALTDLNLDVAFIENLRVDSWLHARVKQSCSMVWLCPAGGSAKHWLMRLPQSWEEFLKLRSKKHRYWLKRIVNILDKDYPGRWRIALCTKESEASEFVRAAEAIAKDTYQRGLGVGFCENEENVGRVKLEARAGRLRGYLLHVDGEPRAFWYCSVSGDTLYMSATGYSPAFRDYEVGTILLMKVFEDHAGRGIEWVDFGLGDAGYKQRFGTDHFLQNTYLLFAVSPRGVLLNLSHRLTFGLGLVAEQLLDRLNLTQKLKTFWRRRIERRAEGRTSDNGGPAEGPQYRVMDEAVQKETEGKS